MLQKFSTVRLEWCSHWLQWEEMIDTQNKNTLQPCHWMKNVPEMSKRYFLAHFVIVILFTFSCVAPIFPDYSTWIFSFLYYIFIYHYKWSASCLWLTSFRSLKLHYELCIKVIDCLKLNFSLTVERKLRRFRYKVEKISIKTAVFILLNLVWQCEFNPD